jgi:glycosyltransferase involved in cell wall biosynthesis
MHGIFTEKERQVSENIVRHAVIPTVIFFSSRRKADIITTMESQVTEQIEVPSGAEEPQVNVALLVDNDYLYRFRSIFSHMLVGLVDQPIHVTLVCPDTLGAASLPIGPAQIVGFQVPFWPWQYRRTLDRLASELRNAKVNLIHSCSGRSCWLAMDLSKRLGIPYIITFNGLFQEECYLRVDHRNCGRLIGISQPICDTLRELYGRSSEKIELIRPGCFIRPRSAKPEQPKTIVSVGELARQSGYDILLQALAEVQSRGLEFLAVIFGKGPLEHSFHYWVNKHGLGKSVSFLAMLPNWEDALGEVEFYVQPGPFYALHSGPYEALAHGCPMIATKDTAMDLLVEGKTGRFFNNGDYRDLANILTEWLGGQTNWQQLSDQALDMARCELSLANSIEKLSNCYRSVLTGARV